MQAIRKAGVVLLCLVLVMGGALPASAAGPEIRIRAADDSGELTLTPHQSGMGKNFRFRTREGTLSGSYTKQGFQAGRFHLKLYLLEDKGDDKTFGLEVGYAGRVERGRVFVNRDQALDVTNLAGVRELLSDVRGTPEGRMMKAAHDMIRRGVIAPVDECLEALFNAMAASIAVGVTCAVGPEDPLCIGAILAYISTILAVSRICGCCYYDPNYNFYFP